MRSSCGSTGPAPPGATCPSDTAPGRRSRVASTAGARGGRLGAGARGATPTGRRGRQEARLGDALLRGLHHRKSAPARRRRKRGDAEVEALGRGRGGFSTKIHLRAEGGGKPMAFVLSAGQRHETIAFEGLMGRGAVRRAGRARPKKLRPHRTSGEKAYPSGEVRRYLRRRGRG
jgi:hypothetical protein